MLRVGLVGSGFMAQTHQLAFDGIDDATITAVASPNTADEFVAETGLDAETYESATAMFESTAIDAVDVCAPSWTHPDVVTEAADRGLDVFCEKPIATSLEEATAMAQTAAASGITFMVGHVLRFFPQYAKLRETVEDGHIGTPAVARARRLSPFPEWGREGWYADESKTGGIFVDLAIHDLDFLRWTIGPIDRIFARRDRWEDREHTHTTVRFENGAVGYVEASWALPQSMDLTTEFELAGADGLLEIDPGTPRMMATDAGVEKPDQLAEKPFQRELEAFVEATEVDRAPPVSAQDAIEALRLSLAARRSAEVGRPVDPMEVTA